MLIVIAVIKRYLLLYRMLVFSLSPPISVTLDLYELLLKLPKYKYSS